ncbi:hypothetical protein MBLNU459_g7623t1 [Dothideomycetes sp. NU459]
MVKIFSLLGLVAGLSVVAAHPGHDIAAEALERRQYYDSVPVEKRSLGQCASKLRARELAQRANARREALVTRKRSLQNIKRSGTLRVRDLDTVLNTTHHTTNSSINMDVTEESLFTDNSSCILVPEVTQGPYYVEGEFIRKNITESQEGVPMTLEIQVIDVNTCEPVPNVFIDFWHCNSTGVYSGIVASGNGDNSDSANVNTTFLRGIAGTDPEGVATFETIMPGHYTSRAPHIHVVTHTNMTLYANSTLRGGNVQHVGQLFFDQSLISTVEETYPYNTNTQDLTLNSADSILSEEVATDGVDPVVEYTLLGDDITDGILAWIAMGVDMTSAYDITPAANYYRTGGVMSDSSSSGGMGGGQGGNSSGSAAPSGSAPPQ